MGNVKNKFMKISNASPVRNEKKTDRQKWHHPRPQRCRDECVNTLLYLPTKQI